MDEIIDFASVLIKLVIILSVLLMAGTLIAMPETAIELAPLTLMLLVPLFLLTLVLGLTGICRRSSANDTVLKPWRHPRRG